MLSVCTSRALECAKYVYMQKCECGCESVYANVRARLYAHERESVPFGHGSHECMHTFTRVRRSNLVEQAI